MNDITKMIVMMVTYLAVLISSILFTISCLVFQPVGMFWYGLMLMGFGAGLRAQAKLWW
jgi:hypothetical protein